MIVCNECILGAVQAKAYTTRVGAGPYPTEIFGELAEDIRRIGAEYGTTTGRPRRVGWLDIPALKYATRCVPHPWSTQNEPKIDSILVSNTSGIGRLESTGVRLCELIHCLRTLAACLAAKCCYFNALIVLWSTGEAHPWVFLDCIRDRINLRMFCR